MVTASLTILSRQDNIFLGIIPVCLDPGRMYLRPQMCVFDKRPRALRVQPVLLHHFVPAHVSAGNSESSM